MHPFLDSPRVNSHVVLALPSTRFTAQVPSHSASASLSATEGADVAGAAVGRGGSGSFSSCLGKALGRRESLRWEWDAPSMGMNTWDNLEHLNIVKKWRNHGRSCAWYLVHLISNY